MTLPSPSFSRVWRGTALLLAALAAACTPACAASFIVNSTDDSGAGTLRAAIESANASADNDLIEFSATTFNTARTISLATALPTLANAGKLEIIGRPNLNSVTPTITRAGGAGAFRLFTVAAGADVSLSSLNLQGGSVAGFGGAVNNTGTLSITDCAFTNNVAGGGGAVSNFGGTLTLLRCTFTSNSAITNGGGLYNATNGALVGTVTATDCSFVSNSAPTGGGVWNAAQITIRRAYFESNSASGGGNNAGGAIRNLNQATVENATFNANSAPGGNGGAILSDSILNLDSATFAGNTAARGRAVFNVGDSTSFTNTIFGGSGSGLNVENGVAGAFTSGGFNISSDNSGPGGSSDRRNLDPGLAASAGSNGGFVKTFALAANSPALDGGNSALTSDARGVTRPLDFTNRPNFQSGNGADVGAFEDNTGTPSLVVTTTVDENNGTSDPNLGAGTSLREAIGFANADGVDSTITFSAGVFGASRQTITLGTELLVNTALSIQTPAVGLILNGGNSNRILRVGPGGNLTMARTYFFLGKVTGNGAFNGGGAILVDGQLTLGDSTFAFNSGAVGSAILVAGGVATLRNCTFSNNAASDSGVVVGISANITMDSCTLADNTGVPGGTSGGLGVGGILVNSSQLRISNTLAAGNSLRDVASANNQEIISSGNNIIGSTNNSSFDKPGDQTGVANVGLAGLNENGGPVPTRALLAGSVAINNGNTLLAADARGVARPQGGTDDSGAFEFDAPLVLSITRLDPNPNQSGGLRFGITFSEAVTGVEVGDFTVVKTGNISGGGIVGITGSGANYTVTVGSVGGSGTIGLNLVDDDSISDGALLLGGTGAGNGNFTGQIYTRNNVASSPVALISEFRFQGANGSADEYVEIYNTTGAPLDISGWQLRTNTGSASAPTFQTATVAANTSPIPARGHFLFTGTAYSLGNYGTSDLSLGADVANDSGAALLDLNNQIQDAVGFASSDPTLRKNAGLSSAPSGLGQYAFMRRFKGQSPVDTGDNAADFLLLTTDGLAVAGTSIAPQLGAPNPEGLNSPNNINAQVGVRVLDANFGPNAAPNRIRIGSGNGGSLVFRRIIKNNTGQPLSRIRLLITDISGQVSPVVAGQADVRVTTQANENVAVAGQGTVLVYGTTLEAPSIAPSGTSLSTVGGGGIGSSVSYDIVLTTPLAVGEERAYGFNVQVAKTGSFFVNINLLGK